ncbi:bifunctional alpha/beta hydrolase/OsmC family protein [Sphingopyxis fribergensis]
MSQPFDFTGRRGHRLSGIIERPTTTPRGWAIFAHCFTCGKDSLAAVRIARALARAGIGVLRFDFAGLGTSEGAFGDTSFADDADDLIAAGAAMTAARMEPLLLLGHSFGGAAALAAAGEMPGIKAIATIAAPAEVSHILRLVDPESLARIETEGHANVLLAGRPFTLGRKFVDDARRQNLPQHVAALHRPLLILHAPRDELVGIDNASSLFAAAKHPKSFVSLDDADHLLSRPGDAEFAAAVIAAWAPRYLSQLKDDLGAPDGGGVLAEETGGGRFQLAMRSGVHSFFADEPVSQGGLDTGLAPYELVSAGLAACTTMTMRLYAERKGYNLAKARTIVTHDKRSDQKPDDIFTRTIELEGELSDEEREKILAIAERCPVDLTLVRGSEVVTRLAARSLAAGG